MLFFHSLAQSLVFAAASDNGRSEILGRGKTHKCDCVYLYAVSYTQFIRLIHSLSAHPAHSLSLSLFLSRAMLMVHVHLMVLYLIVQDYQAPKFQAPIEILSIALPYFCRNENEWVWVCMPGIFIHMWMSKTACVCVFVLFGI